MCHGDDKKGEDEHAHEHDKKSKELWHSAAAANEILFMYSIIHTDMSYNVLWIFINYKIIQYYFKNCIENINYVCCYQKVFYRNKQYITIFYMKHIVLGFLSFFFCWLVTLFLP